MPCRRALLFVIPAIGLWGIWEVLCELRETFPPCIMLNGRWRGQQAYGYSRSNQRWNAHRKNIFHNVKLRRSELTNVGQQSYAECERQWASWIKRTALTESNVGSSQRTWPERWIMTPIRFTASNALWHKSKKKSVKFVFFTLNYMGLILLCFKVNNLSKTIYYK